MVLRGCDKGHDYREEYHDRLTELFSARYAFSFCAGRAALYMLLKAMGIREGDEVIVQGFTCSVVPKSIIYLGAKPIYADINADDYGLTLESVRKRVSEKTRVVVIQHSFGIPCHAMEDIIAFCKGRGIFTIEDCAHTLGIPYKDKLLGTFADAAFFSTDHTKYISTSVGGFAITNDEKIGRTLQNLYQDIPELTQKEQKGIKFQFVSMNIMRNKRVLFLLRHRVLHIIEDIAWRFFDKYCYYMTDYRSTNFPSYTFPAKLSNLQCMIGLSQIKRLSENIHRRHDLAEKYKNLLDKRYLLPKDISAPLRFPILYDNLKTKKLEEVMRGLFAIENWFSPALECIREDDFDRFYYNPSECPVAQYVAAHIVNLPVHLKISDKEVEEICRRMNCLLE